ncbi:4-amino-4-deoxy-L-arabinose transferase [Burkholderiales bacterium 8X]|nr:4-amino-4-deoxy-L-arabinose transferase [Burkholderiales bacterium 8X]
MNQPTPAIVAQSAVRRLPRLALLLLCAAYLMPGLIGRGPWKSADISAYGYMAELAQSGQGLLRWLDPLLLGLRPETPALLPYWIGAWAIKAAPAWISPDLAVRFAYALMLWLTFTATWYAAYYLARTSQAQPVAFAFGGEARPKDYARAIADGALLALIACLGLAQLGHETTPALAQLFFSSQLFYGISALPYRRKGPLVAILVGLAGTALSGAPAVALLLGFFAMLFVSSDRRRSTGSASSEDSTYPLFALSAMIVATALTGLLAAQLGLWHWKIDLPGTSASKSLASDLRSQAKLLLWFTWPAWPLAVWTLWRWRRQLGARHVAVPLLFALVPLAATWTTAFSERSLLLALPALATLAAFALPTFRRSVSALIDWFTLLFFSGSAAIIWGYWIAMQTGYPPKMAASVTRLVPGFIPSVSWLALVFALAATLAWCWLVRWRTGRHRAALWKTLVLPAGGAALCWLLGTTLWLPALDYALSYAPQVHAIAQRVGQPSCISTVALTRPQIAALRYHAQFNLKPLDVSVPLCPWIVAGPDAIGSLHQIVNLEGWRFDGTLRRPTSASDDLLLFQRVAPSGG